VVINDDFNIALDDLQAILRAGRLQCPTQHASQASLIGALLSD